jgi:hypothetical protein
MAVGAKLIKQLPEGAVLVSECRGDFLKGSPFNNDRTQGLIAAVIRIGWLGEELYTPVILHGKYPLGMSVGFQDKPRERVSRNGDAVEGNLGHRASGSGFHAWSVDV